jgi:hypothetical protein
MDVIPADILQNIGLISIILVTGFIILLALALILTYFLFRNTRLIKGLNNVILKALLLILDLLYMPAKKILIMLGGNEMMHDTVSTEIRNILFRNSFAQVPYSGRVIILPQCLRNIDCPAKFNSVEGAQCVGCGKCKIKNIAAKAKELGYIGTYIAPGGGFVKRILKKTKPRAMIGVGCAYEVNWGLLEVSGKGIPCQGVVLLNNGCVMTDIDLNAAYETMELSKKEKPKGSGL